jgi:archaellum biogenesis ATPase FlaH
MDLEKQRIVFELLLSNPDLFAKCNSIIKPNYFDPYLKKSVAYIQEYFEKYHTLPTAPIIKAETKLEITKIPLEKAEQEYVATEIETFCRNKAIEEAILAAPALLEKQDFGTIEMNLKAAIQVSLNRDLGINYFENVEARLRDLLNNSPMIKSGWKDVDEALGGGIIGRQELLLWAASSGIGKSIVMSNLGINLIEQGYNVIYISLELADRIVAKRFDSMVTSISQADILDNISKVVAGVDHFKHKNKGELFIKRMPESTTTANHIRAYLKEFEQTHAFKPDAIIIDYLDLMASNRNISSENIWLKDKFVSEECRAIGFDYDCAIITASQLGRCVEINSLIELENGNKIPIKDVKIGDKIKCDLGFNKVLAKTPISKQKVFKIKTKSGKEVKVSNRHTLPIFDDNGIMLGDISICQGLTVGHKILIDNKI